MRSANGGGCGRSALYLLYICGGGTMLLLQGRLAGGMSMGSAATIMITGPTTQITNAGAIKSVLSVKCFVLYAAFMICSLFDRRCS